MSRQKSKFRKGVMSSYMSEWSDNDLSKNTLLAQVVESRGGNLFLVQLFDSKLGEDEKQVLAKLPNKFNKCIWIKKNDFVMVINYDVPITDGTSSNVGYEVCKILRLDDIRSLKVSGSWPILSNEASDNTKPNSYTEEYADIERNCSVEENYSDTD